MAVTVIADFTRVHASPSALVAGATRITATDGATHTHMATGGVTRTITVPNGYPYAYSPYYDDPYYGSGYVSQPNYSAPAAVYTTPVPSVDERNYQQYTAPRGNQSFYRTPDFYLIAFTDNTIQAALSFRVEGDTLYWTTREHEERQAPLVHSEYPCLASNSIATAAWNLGSSKPRAAFCPKSGIATYWNFAAVK